MVNVIDYFIKFLVFQFGSLNIVNLIVDSENFVES